MRFWLFVFPRDFAVIFSSVGFHAKLLEYYICFSVSLGEKGQIREAVQLSNKKYIPCEESLLRFPLLRCLRRSAVVFVWFSSSGSDLRSTMSTIHSVYASTTPASDLIPSRIALRWGGPCVQTLCWPSVDKLPCCWGAGQCCLQPEVIWLLLNGCRWATALQLLFPCLTSCVSPCSSVCLQDRKLPLRSGKKKMRSGESHLQSWRQCALNGSEKARGAVLGNFCSQWNLRCEDSAKCLHRWMDLIIPDC